ncbi:hypothetical protein [Chryseobacterium indoltheticum]|uniref:ApeA N-terminal domain-containing protein n=1 Tax=Chryseobacterium indoltheticum TaxID=254 RepID=A0A381FBQ8_9FLAO|nr:hypothetical protein [Chryseobacterium indoltheticum]AZA73772.1 hypothetical protein EG358_08405 [Chryseobacterium indoltheticum]SIQ94671.1 hypothetical protein SAMN05421682_110116 [Chryseobacterium indoltheticum]SUX43967.1 Uncharacterised protein [Chryseobacterium indoltheticum]
MSASTIRIENKKNFESELQFIEKICSLSKYELKIIDNDEDAAYFSRGSKTFNFEREAIFEQREKDENKISFILNNIVLVSKKFGNTSSSNNIKVDKYIDFKTTIELKEFHSEGFKTNSIFKAFFKVGLNEINTFHNEFETITHVRDEVEYFYDCLRIKIKETEYDVTQLKSNNEGYYIIESLQKQNYEEFSKGCFSIQQAIGFINCLMIGDEKFVFDGCGGFYYTNNIRPMIKGMYRPIITNPYSCLEIDRKTANILYKKHELTRVSLQNLSKLVHKIHMEPEFSIAILVILEATSTKSLLIIPSSFAVIIEQLSKHFSIEESGLERPINNKKLQEKIITELNIVIDDNSDSLTSDTILKLKRRLNEINKPFNKAHLTNNEKLTRPFEQIGIDLSLHDITIIEHRNDLLHGNILIKKDNIVRDESTTNLYLSYVSAKLFTLISKLIFKSVGYSGYVYNQSKYLEKYMAIETEEKYFEKI